MANDKYSIEIELKSKLEEASRAIEQINELKNAANELSKNISSTKTIVNGALYEFGAKLSDLALKIPSVATQAIKAFGEEELAVEKLSAAIRHNGGMVSEADILFAKFPVAFSMSFKASMAFNASSAFALSSISMLYLSLAIFFLFYLIFL